MKGNYKSLLPCVKMSKWNFGGKCLNNKIHKDYYVERNKDGVYANHRSIRRGCAQMLLAAGIVIAVSVIIVSVLSVRLSEVGVELYSGKGFSILEEFRNVRDKFGLALSDRIPEGTSPNEIYTIFNETKNAFYTAETRYGFYFDCVLNNIVFVDENVVGVNVTLTLMHQDAKMVEDIIYPVAGGV